MNSPLGEMNLPEGEINSTVGVMNSPMPMGKISPRGQESVASPGARYEINSPAGEINLPTPRDIWID